MIGDLYVLTAQLVSTSLYNLQLSHASSNASNSATYETVTAVAGEVVSLTFTATGTDWVRLNQGGAGDNATITVDNVSVTKVTESVTTSRKDVVYLTEAGVIGVYEGNSDSSDMVEAGFTDQGKGLWYDGGTYAVGLNRIQ